MVTAGAWGPTRAAVAAVTREPLCIDLPGDPFADAQAVAGFSNADATADSAAATFIPALLRGDAFTTVSGPSRHALLGQLGLLGRLARTPPGSEWAHVTPIAWHFPGFVERAAPPPAGPVRVAIVGSFNTWFDGETLLEGLLRAMDRGPLTATCVDGAVPGHHTATWDAFVAGATASRHAARFELLPRQTSDRLAGLFARSHVGVCLDRAGYEPELGSRTRLLLYLHQGLRVVATARCELARDLAAGGYIEEVPSADPEALACALLGGRARRDPAPLRARYGVTATTAGLRAWAAAPARRAVPGDAEPTAALRRERDALAGELAAVRGSPTWRALDRLRRLLHLTDTRTPK